MMLMPIAAIITSAANPTSPKVFATIQPVPTKIRKPAIIKRVIYPSKRVSVAGFEPLGVISLPSKESRYGDESPSILRIHHLAVSKGHLLNLGKGVTDDCGALHAAQRP
jgi:hypothetical protein